jgi:hypothetical protein
MGIASSSGKTRVRIPPGHKVFRENIAMLLCTDNCLNSHCLCVLVREIKALVQLKKTKTKTKTLVENFGIWAGLGLVFGEQGDQIGRTSPIGRQFTLGIFLNS